jgi:hypothetical protein
VCAMAINWPGAAIPIVTKPKAKAKQTATQKKAKAARTCTSDIFPAGVNILADIYNDDGIRALENLDGAWGRGRTFNLSRDHLIAALSKATKLPPDANLTALCNKSRSLFLQICMQEHMRHGMILSDKSITPESCFAEFREAYGTKSSLNFQVHDGTTPGTQFIQGPLTCEWLPQSVRPWVPVETAMGMRLQNGEHELDPADLLSPNELQMVDQVPVPMASAHQGLMIYNNIYIYIFR